jgi:hypothetical protein
VDNTPTKESKGNEDKAKEAAEETKENNPDEAETKCEIPVAPLAELPAGDEVKTEAVKDAKPDEEIGEKPVIEKTDKEKVIKVTYFIYLIPSYTPLWL